MTPISRSMSGHDTNQTFKVRAQQQSVVLLVNGQSTKAISRSDGQWSKYNSNLSFRWSKHQPVMNLVTTDSEQWKDPAGVSLGVSLGMSLGVSLGVSLGGES